MALWEYNSLSRTSLLSNNIINHNDYDNQYSLYLPTFVYSFTKCIYSTDLQPLLVIVFDTIHLFLPLDLSLALMYLNDVIASHWIVVT